MKRKTAFHYFEQTLILSISCSQAENLHSQIFAHRFMHYGVSFHMKTGINDFLMKFKF